MADKIREIAYFEKPSRANTDKVIGVVAKRLEEGDLDTVIVASTTGYTVLKLSDALGHRARIISTGETSARKGTSKHKPASKN